MTLKRTSAQVVETSVIVNNNSSFQNYTNLGDHTRQTSVISVLMVFGNVIVDITIFRLCLKHLLVVVVKYY